MKFAFIKRSIIFFILFTLIVFFFPADGFQAADLWSALGSGVNSSVLSLEKDGSGNLYAGGSFTSAGGVPANYVAKWDGSTWSPLGSGANSFIFALEVDGSAKLYAGGLFTSAGGVPANRIAKWDGNSWSALGSGMNGTVYALALDGSGNLYAGGNFTSAGGVPASSIAKWDGNSWSALGSGVNYSVLSLATDGSGNLYAGGNFTGAGGLPANRIAKWDGISWSALGSGVYNQVNVLAVDGSGNLYAGGYVTLAGGVPASGIAKWDGISWSALGSGVNSQVNALAVDGSGNLYAGGNFTSAGGVPASRIAKWDGTTWSAMGSGVFDTVRALAMDGSGLYTGGLFTLAGGVPVNFVAKWMEDNTPPTVVTTTPADGATILPTNTLLVTFSEEMNHNGGSDAANYPGNYVLVESRGNGFQTTACSSTDFVNDARINIDEAVYDNHSGSGPFETTLAINQGNPLPQGEYKLFICGTTSVTDLPGNKINGGEDASVLFFVAPMAALPQTGFAPYKVTLLPSQPVDRAYQALGAISLEIPSLNINAPVIGVPRTRDGWDLTWLGGKVGWLEGTAFPTWAGNTALTAHVVDANGQPGLFSNVGGLSYGREIIIHAWGQRYVYQVRSVRTNVKPSDVSAFRHQAFPYLTLITCKGYDEKRDSYQWRVVVQAVQVRVE
jgi:LPXTG-site transpeptidase (sortase) family protein